MALLLAACSQEQMNEWIKRDCISQIAAQVVQPSNIELNARFNPWGGGVFVYGSQTSDLERRRYVWISLHSRDLLRPTPKIPKDTFSLSPEVASLTPTVPLLSTASDKTRTDAGLTNVPWDDIVKYLQIGSPPTRR